MAWNGTNPVTVGAATKKDHYDRAFDNLLELRTGGFALASQAIGDLMYATSTTQWGRLAAVATGQVLVSAGTGTAPTWSASPTVTTLNGYTFNQSVASGASPTFTGTNITGIPETAITDGSILARLAANETVTGAWTFNNAALNQTSTAATRMSRNTAHATAAVDTVLTRSGVTYWDYGMGAWSGDHFDFQDGASLIFRVSRGTGDGYLRGPFEWGGGSAISSSSNVALLNASNTFTNSTQIFTSTVDTATTFDLKNASTGTSAVMLLRMFNGTNDSFVIRAYSSAHATLPNLVSFDANRAGGLKFIASDASGDIVFANRGGTTALTLGASQAATFAGSIVSSVSVALTGTTNNLGTITTGVWNAGAVTSSGTVTGVAGTFSGVLSTTSSLAIASGSNFYFDGVAASGDTYMEESSANVLDTYAGGVLTTRVEAGSFKVLGAEAGAATLYLWADEGDDAADKWSLQAGTGGYLDVARNAVTVGLWSPGALQIATDTGSAYNVNIGGGTTSSCPNLSFTATDGGSNAGSYVALGRNSNASPAAGYIYFQESDGGYDSVWVDATGKLRIYATFTPTNANDTAGTVVGDQTSMRSLKNIYGEFTDYTGALAALCSVRLWDFDFKSGSYNAQRFVGLTLGDDPSVDANLFGKDRDADNPWGKSLNEITLHGYEIAAIRALNEKLDAAYERIAELEARHA